MLYPASVLKSHNIFFYTLLMFIAFGCQQSNTQEETKTDTQDLEQYLVILGIAQDAGYPQANCKKACCEAHWKNGEPRRHATALALVDKLSNQSWLFEATPDIKDQLHLLSEIAPQPSLSGIFLTHAHIGHYAGLIQFGREVMGTHEMPVYAMPRMSQFLEGNGPWDQLIGLNNIDIKPLQANEAIPLSNNLKVTPFTVPHRDEYSETVGYKISSPNKSILFIPDINKWGAWERNIIAEIDKVDIAFIDGTFYANGEIPGRDMSEIPHPFIQESIDLFHELSIEEKSKIHFIHFNHTNPVFRGTPERTQIIESGFQLAYEGQIIPMQ